MPRLPSVKELTCPPAPFCALLLVLGQVPVGPGGAAPVGIVGSVASAAQPSEIISVPLSRKSSTRDIHISEARPRCPLLIALPPAQLQGTIREAAVPHHQHVPVTGLCLVVTTLPKGRAGGHDRSADPLQMCPIAGQRAPWPAATRRRWGRSSRGRTRTGPSTTLGICLGRQGTTWGLC